MSDYTGRYYSSRDRFLIDSFNAELAGDIVQCIIDLYKISPEDTKTNVYGESDSSGKFFFQPIQMTCWTSRNADIETNDGEGFGPDRSQDRIFSFREKMLQLVNWYPQVGDIIGYNERLHEIDNVVQENMLGTQPTKSLDIICHTHYSRLSKLNLVPRQS